ncbi:putative salt-induced outer membrane protein [Sinobacterium caligoides]|uniref:Putative salt-induced outer membrane protein n=1 Tax=Sinobacterium caligoides TaxID=933926 RepID=A0A3N2DYS0_9GAMM|nr:DUF481 domain-containing protein [Sinobacterium caligoides]ROS04993.1 putative salt-induced outer membrane protein [Sinobacterium caligoides]
MKVSILAAAVLVSASAMAEENPQWNGSLELGYINTSGNTTSTTMTSKFSLETDREKWRHALNLSGYNNSDDDVRSAESYNANWQSNYKFNEVQSMFGRIEYEDDRFNGWDYQVTGTAGYSHRLLFNDDMTLDLEAGPGYRYSVYDQDYMDDDGNLVWDPSLGETQSEALVRAAADFNWDISDTAHFRQEASTEAGHENVINRSVTSLTMDLTDVLAVKLSYEIKFTREVLPTVNQYDRKTVVSVGYKF